MKRSEKHSGHVKWNWLHCTGCSWKFWKLSKPQHSAIGIPTGQHHPAWSMSLHEIKITHSCMHVCPFTAHVVWRIHPEAIWEMTRCTLHPADSSFSTLEKGLCRHIRYSFPLEWTWAPGSGCIPLRVSAAAFSSTPLASWLILIVHTAKSDKLMKHVSNCINAANMYDKEMNYDSLA